jgi:ElaB/YqjD/DUF883 family membrane-anchored ribosome-binding protein
MAAQTIPAAVFHTATALPPLRNGTFATGFALPARSILCFKTGALMVDDSSGQIQADGQPGKASDAEILAALASLREDVRRLTDDLAHYAQSQRAGAEAVVTGAINDARSQISQVASGLEGFVCDAEADMRTRIRAKPIASVLIAAAVGYALRCMRRRR